VIMAPMASTPPKTKQGENKNKRKLCSRAAVDLMYSKKGPAQKKGQMQTPARELISDKIILPETEPLGGESNDPRRSFSPTGRRKDKAIRGHEGWGRKLE